MLSKYSLVIISVMSFAFVKAQQEHDNSTNSQLELTTKIKEGLIKEQEIRKAFGASVKSGKIDMALNNQMIEIDSINQIYLHKYLEKFGYPYMSIDGKELCDAAFYILQHGELEHMKKYFPDLKDRAFKGEASKIHYAMMQDRILMHEGKKQIFGTQVSLRKDENGFNTSRRFIWPISDPENVNKRRKEIGFTSTIEGYAVRMNAEYEINEKLIQHN